MSNQIAAVFAEIRRRLEHCITANNVRYAGTVRDVAEGRIADAYLYVQVGGDRMLKISACNRNGDVWTGDGWARSWWCCCPDTEVYVKNTTAKAQEVR